MTPRNPWRKRLWSLVAWLFYPIGMYAFRARARACGCLACQMLLVRPLLTKALVQARIETMASLGDDDKTPTATLHFDPKAVN